MIVLGFDTATPATSVALMLSDNRTLQARDDPSGDQRPGHATRLLPLANQLLDDAALNWSDIERIAVGIGPGTFTGLRIGVATARGLAQSRDVELVGISSLHALAHAVYTNRSEKIDDATAVLAVIDARRSETFVAAYNRHIELLEPQVCAPRSLRDLLTRSDAPMTQKDWIAVGDGALRYREALEHPDLRLPDERSPLHRVDARAICELGTHANAPHVPIIPDYRRQPDAEIKLEAASAS